MYRRGIKPSVFHGTVNEPPMKQSPEPIAILLKRLSRLEELVHDLSNSDGLMAAYLTQTLKGPSGAWPERLATALELSMKARETLMSLMWEIGQIRISAQEQGYEQEKR
jgi:hypothetical protein